MSPLPTDPVLPTDATLPGIADLRAAAERIRGLVLRTPVMTSGQLDALAGAELFFKCENLQRCGAFKFRGASNAVALLAGSPDPPTAIATHSSGNHAQAVARAARDAGLRATIVMPAGAPAVKTAAVQGYGADVRFSEPTAASREALCREVIAETGAAFLHPYNDARIIAGQGTAALELFEETGPLDCVVAPVSGGGLLAGTALAAEEAGCQVVAAEPAAADDTCRSFATGTLQGLDGAPATIADGLRMPLGELPFAILQDRLESVIRVEEAEILPALRLIWERMKLVVEPSAAVALAAVLRAPERFRGRRVGILLSGGNVDLDKLRFS